MHFSAKRGIAIARRPSVCLSVCNVGGSGPHRLQILETNCTDNKPNTFALRSPKDHPPTHQGTLGNLGGRLDKLNMLNKIQKKQQDKNDVICNVQNVTLIFTVKRKQRQQTHSVTRKVMTCQKQVTKNAAINPHTVSSHTDNWHCTIESW